MGWPAGSGALPAGTGMSYSAAWFGGGLYFYVEVTDPDLYPALATGRVWQGDAVEISVDHDGVFATPGFYDDPGTKQIVIGSPADGTTPGERAEVFIPTGLQSEWANGQWTSIATASGYVVEAVISAADLGLGTWTLQAGDVIGFDLAHDVSVPLGQIGNGFSGRRLGQYFLRLNQPVVGTIEDYPFHNSAAFCSATLLE